MNYIQYDKIKIPYLKLEYSFNISKKNFSLRLLFNSIGQAKSTCTNLKERINNNITIMHQNKSLTIDPNECYFDNNTIILMGRMNELC